MAEGGVTGVQKAETWVNLISLAKPSLAKDRKWRPRSGA